MADNLRNRIAAVISGVDDWRSVTDPMILADAVIEALNLKIVVDYMSVDGQRRNFMLAGRYHSGNSGIPHTTEQANKPNTNVYATNVGSTDKPAGNNITEKQ